MTSKMETVDQKYCNNHNPQLRVSNRRQYLATETKVEETNQPAPCYNKSFVSCCGGLKISAKIEQLPDHYPCPVPKWSALTFDADKKIKGRSVAADLIRLFATPKFWTAASTGNQEAIDEQARKLVPIIPFWDQPTWRRVAKMEPEQQYAVAVWISQNCGRQPKVGTLNRINDLNVLVEAWINFDKHSRWIDPTLASASQVTDFVRTVDKFLRSDESKMQMDHLYKRIARKGANVTLTRTKQVIEGSVIWKKRGRPSADQLDRIFVNELGWNHEWFKPNNTNHSDSFIKLARQSIQLAKAKETI
jgi:hypothetical protein